MKCDLIIIIVTIMSFFLFFNNLSRFLNCTHTTLLDKVLMLNVLVIWHSCEQIRFCCIIIIIIIAK